MRECRSAGAAGSPQALAEEVPGVARHITSVFVTSSATSPPGRRELARGGTGL